MKRLGSALVTVAVLVGGALAAPAAGATVAAADQPSAADALSALTVRPAADQSTYDRAQFGTAWTDDNDEPDGRNGCDTRNDILRRDLTGFTLDASSNGCTVLSGTLHNPYTGDTISFTRGASTSTAVQIDHVVSLGAAWRTGASTWTARQRVNIANDPLNLLAVDQHSNLAKSDGDASEWLPPTGACGYAARQVAVKTKFGLWVTTAEHDALARVLAGCPSQTLPVDGATPLGLREAAATSAAPGSFTPVTPFRTTGEGAPLALGEGSSTTVPLAGVGPVPSDATGVVVNVTVASASATTFLTVYPAGSTRPVVSNVNADPGQTVANLAQLALGAGAITVYNNRGTTTFDLDVVGYFGGASTSGFTPLAPTRILDTRSTGQRIGTAGTLAVPVTGRGGVPTSASAVVFNLTAADPSAVSYVTAYPAGVARPFVSSLNTVPNRNTPNLVTVGVGSGGAVDVYNNQGATDVILDVVGYYSADSTLQFTGVTPGRLFDTRTGEGRPVGRVGAASSITTPVGYFGVPSDAQAVVTHVTATGGSTNGDFVTAYPAGRAVPLASTANPDAGATVANLAVVPVGSGGVSLYNQLGTIDLLADVTGYYAPTYGNTAPSTTPPFYAPPPPTTPTPPAASLRCVASVSNSSPTQYSTVNVLVDTGAGNAAVTATAHYKTTDTTNTGSSGADGSAVVPFKIARATVGYTVSVDVTTSLNGQTASCRTSFTPVA